MHATVQNESSLIHILVVVSDEFASKTLPTNHNKGHLSASTAEKEGVWFWFHRWRIAADKLSWGCRMPSPAYHIAFADETIDGSMGL